MKKNIVGSFFFFFFLVGCGQIPSDKEMIESFNFYQLRDAPFKVKSIENLDCNLEGYGFPEEKEIPSYMCTGKFFFTSGDSGQLKIAASRRMNGELVIDLVGK